MQDLSKKQNATQAVPGREWEDKDEEVIIFLVLALENILLLHLPWIFMIPSSFI